MSFYAWNDNGTMKQPEESVSIASGYARTIKAEWTYTQPRIYQNALVLDGVLRLKYFLVVPVGFNGDNAVMTFSIDHQLGADQVIPYDSAYEEDGCKVFECAVYAYQMADNIRAAFTYYENGEKKTVVDNYSVAQYLNKLLAADSGSTEKTRALVKATQNYGHYVQPLMKRLYPELSAVTEMQKAEDVDVDVAAAKTGSAAAAQGIDPLIIDRSVTPNVWIRLNANTGTDLVIEFALAQGVSGEVKASVDGGDYVTLTLDERGVYRVAKEGIAANNLANRHTFKISVGDQEVISIGAAAMDYINMVLHSASTRADETMANAALYEYWHATRDLG